MARPQNAMPLNLSEKKVFVAGETGLVGRALVSALKNENINLLSAPHNELDLTDQKRVRDWFEINRPEIVIMAAGRVGGILANQSQPADFIADNLAMALNVIDASHKNNVEKLLYLGTSCIYPRDCPQPIEEEYILTGALEETNKPYALAKIAGIQLCQSYRMQYGCDFISAMPTNLYGPYDRFDTHGSHVMPALMLKLHDAKIKNAPVLSLMGTGQALREFLYVDDLAEALLLLLKNYSASEPINIGSGQEVSIQELVYLIAETVGYIGNIQFAGDGPDGTPRKFLDSSKINALGWKAKTPLKEGLAQTYQWFLENHDIKKAA